MLDLEASADKLHVEFGLLDAWYEPFLKMTRDTKTQCEAVVAEFETRLNFYGYSMAHPTHILPSAFVKEINGN